VNLPAFGIRQPVPANLLMLVLVVGGIAAMGSIPREFFPESDPEAVVISLRYPGASPEQIESTVAVKVEDQLAELEEVKEIRTTLAEGGGGVTAELHEWVDEAEVLDEIERALDQLTDLPEELERLEAVLLEPEIPIIQVLVHGDLEEAVLKRAIRGVRDDLRSLPGMGRIVVAGVRDYEMRVDVREAAMVAHGLALPEIAGAVSRWVEEVPGGSVRAGTGEFKVRTRGVPERAAALRELVVGTDPAGGVVRLAEIATVRDGFVDEPLRYRFDGRPAANLTLYKVGEQDIVDMAGTVRAYVAGRRGEPAPPVTRLARWFGDGRPAAWRLGRRGAHPLPVGAEITVNADFARFVEGRLDLLLRNALYGAMLVFATLLLLLNWRVALWVGVGLVTAIGGTLALMDATGITLNMLTMFGLIVVLGLLVDDAIVVSENIQARHEAGEPALTAAVTGTGQVAWPVVATVLTSIVAFLPLMFIRGRIGDLLGALPLVVACALFMSLLESILILPSHMGHTLARRARLRARRPPGRLARFETWRDRLLMKRLVPAYGRLLGRLLRWRYAWAAAAVAALTLSLGLLAGGRVVYNFLPAQDAETIAVGVRMPVGTPAERTAAVIGAIEAAARAQPEVRHVTSVVGERNDVETGATERLGSHRGQLFIELLFVEARDRSSMAVIASIRQTLAERGVAAERITWRPLTGGPGGPDISLRLTGGDPAGTAAAAEALSAKLAGFDGVIDVWDDAHRGQLEIAVEVRPEAARRGFTVRQVAEQVRGALFGITAHVFADREEDIDIRVRLEEGTRGDLAAVLTSWVAAPDGRWVPLGEIVRLRESTSFATLERVDRARAVTVSADTDPSVTPEQVMAALDLGAFRAAHPGVRVALAGRQQQQAEAFASLPWGMGAALGMIYVILAWLFGRFGQPLAVLLVVPFSFIGVIGGHFLLGYQITFLSLIGAVALAGIVVNDSLILVQFMNESRASGRSFIGALIRAGRARFRPILLTTVTTVLGLTPLILERSFQARFLIPMGIAIAAGLLAATVLVLTVLPCFLMIFEDGRRLARWAWGGGGEGVRE